MNNCHGKHDGKFCSGSNAGGGDQIKKGADDHYQQAISKDARIKKATDDHFNDPAHARMRAEVDARIAREKYIEANPGYMSRGVRYDNQAQAEAAKERQRNTGNGKPLPLYYGNDSPAGTDAFGRDIKKSRKHK